MTRTETCLPCSMEGSDEARIVFRDEAWSCEVVPGYDVPGWFVLRTRRHAERIQGLDDNELAGYASRLRDLVAAVTEVTGAPATYQLTFGEANPHFHTLVAARGVDVPPDRRMGNLLGLLATHQDGVGALALVPEVAAAYRRQASVEADATGASGE